MNRRSFLKGALALAGALAFPKAIVDLLRRNDLPQTMRLDWTDNDPNEIPYVVQYRARAHNARGWSPWSKACTTTGVEKGTIVTGLHPTTTYDFRMRPKA